jgi:hypothetical protein
MRKTAFLAGIVALALLALPLYAQDGTWTGWITDEHCGAKGAKAGHEDCAKKCIEKGGALVFYNSGDQKIYKLDKQDVAKQHLGHEVKVSGHVEGDTIQVSSIEESMKGN